MPEGIASKTGRRRTRPHPAAGTALLTPVRHSDALATCAALAVTIGALFGGFDSSFGNPIVGLISAGLAGIALAAIAPRPHFWRSVAPVMALLGGAWLWGLLVSYGALPGAPALTPDLAPGELVGMAASGAALIAGRILADRPTIRDRVIDLIAAFGAIAATIGLVAWQSGITLSDYLWQAGQSGRFAGTLGNANVAGTFYAAIATLCLARLVSVLERERSAGQPIESGVAKALRGLATALALGACMATASRTAMACAMVAIAILLSTRNARGRGWIGLMLAAATIILALLILFYGDRLLTRLPALATDWEFRREMWTHYADLAAGARWTGYGLGSFPSINAQSLGDPMQAAELWPVNAAHNILLHLMLAAGLPFAGLVSAAVAVIAWDLVGSWRRGGFGTTAAGIAVAVAVILVNAMVDIALNVPAMAILFWLLLGLAWGSAGFRPRRA